MKFSELQRYFELIAQTSSRTETTKLLAELFHRTTAREAQIIAYLALGSLRPQYEGTEFNLAERSVKKILEELLEISHEKLQRLMKEYGDLGMVVAHGTWKPHQTLTVEQVYEGLMLLEEISGVGSQEERAKAFQRLLRALEPIEAGLVIRIVVGKLRLGFSDMTLIDALSWMLVENKSLHARIEHAYNVCADIGHIAFIVKQDGIDGIDKVKVTVGIPIRPAAAERLPTAEDIISKLGHCIAQPKIDGFRLQVHIDRTHDRPLIKFFSRNLLNMSDMFPDLHAGLAQVPAKTCILEGEAIAFDEATGSYTPFQETVKRKRKHDIEEISQELPLRLFVFDLLYLNGEPLLAKAYHTRRTMLLQLMKHVKSDNIQVIEEHEISTAHQLENYFMEMISEGLEGVVVKKPNAHYQPGKRNFNWVKLKRQEHGYLEDTIDAVILGYYYGKGKRAQFGIGAFLVGVYDKKDDRFETIAKIGTGLTDVEWKDLKKSCDALARSTKPNNVICSKELVPDVWVDPALVVMVRADEISQSPVHTAGKTAEELGFALRFPRIMGYRPDKSAQETTTVKEIHTLYTQQRKH